MAVAVVPPAAAVAMVDVKDRSIDIEWQYLMALEAAEVHVCTALVESVLQRFRCSTNVA